MTKKINWQQFNPTRNANGDNCGTGAGGFQPGNTCGSKRGASHNVTRLVDYDAYTSHDTWREPNGQGGWVEKSKPPPMGGLPAAYRTTEMKDVLADSKRFVGRQPQFFNVSKNSIGLKYELRDGEDEAKFHVFKDTLLDRGFDARVDKSNNHVTLDKQLLSRVQRYADSLPGPPDDIWEIQVGEYQTRLERQYMESGLYKNYITIVVS